MIELRAPFEGPINVLVLPNPTFGDAIQPLASVNLYKTVKNGNKYTYIKNPQLYQLTYNFTGISRSLIVKTQQFVTDYSVLYIRLILGYRNNEAWRVRFAESTLNTATDQRWPLKDCAFGERGESGNFSFSLIGVRAD